MLLDGSEKYTYIVEYALKAKSGPSAKIVIEPKVTEKQNFCIQSSFLPVIWVDAFWFMYPEVRSERQGKHNWNFW